MEIVALFEVQYEVNKRGRLSFYSEAQYIAIDFDFPPETRDSQTSVLNLFEFSSSALE